MFVGSISGRDQDSPPLRKAAGKSAEAGWLLGQQVSQYAPHEISFIRDFVTSHLHSHLPRESKTTSSNFWRSLFKSRFSIRAFSIAEQIVVKGTTTWKTAFEFFASAETHQKFTSAQPRTRCLVGDTYFSLDFIKDPRGESGEEDHLLQVGVIDLISLEVRELKINKPSSAHSLLTADKDRLFVYAKSHEESTISVFDCKDFRLLDEFPAKITAMQAVDGVLYTLSEQSILEVFYYNGDFVDSKRFPHTFGSYTYLSSQFADTFFLPRNESKNGKLQVTDLTGDKLSLVKSNRSFFFFSGYPLDWFRHDGLLFLATANSDPSNINFSRIQLYVYEDEKLLQKYFFLTKEHFFDHFTVVNGCILFYSMVNSTIIAFDLIAHQFYPPFENVLITRGAFAGKAGSYACSYFEFQEEGLERLLSFLSRRAPQICRTDFSAKKPIKVEVPAKLHYTNEMELAPDEDNDWFELPGNGL